MPRPDIESAPGQSDARDRRRDRGMRREHLIALASYRATKLAPIVIAASHVSAAHARAHARTRAPARASTP
jgi:hypothetical protein